MSATKCFIVLLVGSCAAALAGCSKNDGKQPVNGRVELDGQPVDGEITFYPVEKGVAAEGATISGGSYTARLKTGKYVVKVNASKKVPLDPGEPSVSGEKDKSVEAIPKKYNDETTLSADVTDSQKTFDFKLTKK